MTKPAMLSRLARLNWMAAGVIFILPAILGVGAIAYGRAYGIGWYEAGLFLAAYYGANISIGVAMHRLWAHGAYKTKPWVEAVFALLTAGTLQGPVLAWVSDHNKHHTHTDEAGDPHSPLKYANPVKGFLWSHLGWMLAEDAKVKDIDRATMVRLGRNRILLWQLKHYWAIALFMNLALPAAIGFALAGSWQGVLGAVLAMGLGRAVQQQVTFCVNSLCHTVGSRPYAPGTARDIWWFFPALLGENWHNFHHAFARDYRNGAKWYQPDIHKWIIAGMERLGLAWDLQRTAPERIAAKQADTAEKLAEAQSGLSEALAAARARLDEAVEAARAAAACEEGRGADLGADWEAAYAQARLKAADAALAARAAAHMARDTVEAQLSRARRAAREVADQMVREAESALARAQATLLSARQEAGAELVRRAEAARAAAESRLAAIRQAASDMADAAIQAAAGAEPAYATARAR